MDKQELVREFENSLREFRRKNDATLDEFRNELKAEQRRGDELEKQVDRGLVSPDGPSGRSRAKYEEFNTALRQSLKAGDLGPVKAFAPQNAMSVGSDPDGGYTVFPELDAGIGSILRNISPFRRVARIRPTATGDAFEERYSLGGAGASWVNETGVRTATSAPELKVLRVPLHEIYAMPEASQKLIDDSASDVTAWLNEQVAMGFNEAEGAAFVSGNGMGKPRGLLNYGTVATPDATRAWEVLEHIAGDFGASPDTVSDALIDMTSALKAGYRARAIWMMNSVTAGRVRKIRDNEGRKIWQDSLQQGNPALLLGHPVVLNEDMPDVATNAYPVAFGDFQSGYVIADRPGVRLLVDPFTNKPNVRLYTYKRVGGDVRDFNAIKLLKSA